MPSKDQCPQAGGSTGYEATMAMKESLEQSSETAEDTENAEPVTSSPGPQCSITPTLRVVPPHAHGHLPLRRLTDGGATGESVP